VKICNKAKLEFGPGENIYHACKVSLEFCESYECDAYFMFNDIQVDISKVDISTEHIINRYLSACELRGNKDY
jgi:hypothetical protein